MTGSTYDLRERTGNVVIGSHSVFRRFKDNAQQFNCTVAIPVSSQYVFVCHLIIGRALKPA